MLYSPILNIFYSNSSKYELIKTELKGHNLSIEQMKYRLDKIGRPALQM